MPSLVTPVTQPAIKVVSNSSFKRWKYTTNSSDVGWGTNFPIGFTFQEFVRFFYGVKDYTLSVTASGFVDPPVGVNRNFSVSHSETIRVAYQDQPVVFTGYTSESDFIVDPRAHMRILGKATTVGGSYSATLLWQDIAHFPDPGTLFSGYIFSNTFYPRFQPSYYLVDGHGSPNNGDVGLVAFGAYPPGNVDFSNGANGTNTTGLFSGSFFGKTMQFFGCNNFPVTLSSATFTISSTSWWPYDPGDGGGPCWDASDGSQLRSDLPGLT
jgi:hypothetical protein